MTDENKKAEEALKELQKKVLEDVIEELTNPKFPKRAVGYMYFNSEHAKKQKEDK